MEYELMEDLTKEPPTHAVSTTEAELDEVIRMLSTMGGAAEEEDEEGIPKPSENSVDFQ
jgi:hypothetical protein